MLQDNTIPSSQTAPSSYTLLTLTPYLLLNGILIFTYKLLFAPSKEKVGMIFKKKSYWRTYKREKLLKKTEKVQLFILRSY